MIINPPNVYDPINPIPASDPMDPSRVNNPIDPFLPNGPNDIPQPINPEDPDYPIDPTDPEQPTPMSMIKRIYPFLFVAKEERVEREISLYGRPNYTTGVLRTQDQSPNQRSV